MDSDPSLAELNEMLTSLQASSLAHYNLLDVPESLGEDLHSLLQRRQDKKAVFLKAEEEKLVLYELGKHPEQWLTIQSAEARLLESKEILSEISSLSSRTDKQQETINVASEALDALKEKLMILEEKIGKLEEKYKKLSVVSSPGLDNMPSGTECSVRTVSEMLSAAKIERDLVRERLKRTEHMLNYFKELTSAQSSNVAARRSKISRMEERLKEMESISGLRCHLRDDTTVDIDFLSDTIGEDSKDNATPDDTHLTCTLIFKEDDQKILHLDNIQLNQEIEKAERLIQDAKLDKDVPKLITELKKLWKTHVPLIKEISQIRSRHAVDWIQDKHLLLLMPKKCSSVVCALKVPVTYPFSGEVVLETVMGHTSQSTLEDIRPPMNTSLRSWVIYLEDLFTNS